MKLLNIILPLFISTLLVLVRSDENFGAEAEANEFVDEVYESELLLAVRNGDLVRVEDLLKDDAFVDDSGDTTFTPLMVASQKGDIDACNLVSTMPNSTEWNDDFSLRD
jgi:hypothetical protein